MADPTNPTVASELIALLPVIVGGAIALAGGVIGAGATHFFTARRDRAAAKRERLEKLVTAVHDLNIWAKKNDNYYLFGRDEVLEQPPMATVMTVTRLYFPDLKPEATALDNAVDAYVLWLMEGAKLRLAATPPVVPAAHTTSVTAVWNPILTARSNLLLKAETLMKSL
jgi:hypothetical protein